MRFPLACFLLFLFSCIEPKPEKTRTGLFARLSAAKTDLNSLDEGTIKACVKNYGPYDTTINEFIFQNAILALEVKDDSGRALLSLPPPVPPIGLNEYNRVLHPGDSVLYTYKLDIFVLPERKGIYHVRLNRVNSEEAVVNVK